jgi:phenylacetate-CoA ligase
MRDWLVHAYYNLPGPARAVAASMRGYYLRSWRYGPETGRLVAEAHERESWSSAQWESWRQERLSYILHRAATTVPYYRDAWARRRRSGDNASWSYLEHWPVLEKDAVRRNAAGFVAGDVPERTLFHDHTSGTSGKPLDIWMSRRTLHAWYALFEARWRRWHGVSLRDRWANLGGQLIVPVARRTPPFWVWNSAFHQLYMSSYHLAPDLIPFYLDALRRHEISYLLGYTSSLTALAHEIIRRKRTDLGMKVVLTNAEPLAHHQRELIEEAFRCPVRETYGMTEMVAAAGECQKGRMHVWPEAGVLEFRGGGDGPGEEPAGEMVCTGLINPDMPLIRYRMGDRGRQAAANELCACGRSLPLIGAIEGRQDDTLLAEDGRRIGRLDTVFKERLPIREAQILQESLGVVRVKYVPDEEFTAESGRIIVRRLKERMGNIEVILEEVREIPRSANGKFRAVVCNVPQEQRKQFRE